MSAGRDGFEKNSQVFPCRNSKTFFISITSRSPTCFLAGWPRCSTLSSSTSCRRRPAWRLQPGWATCLTMHPVCLLDQPQLCFQEQGAGRGGAAGVHEVCRLPDLHGGARPADYVFGRYGAWAFGRVCAGGHLGQSGQTVQPDCCGCFQLCVFEDPDLPKIQVINDPKEGSV